MNKVDMTARKQPAMFGFAVTFIFIAILFASAALGAVLPGEGYRSSGCRWRCC